jgi:hypothetical protein
MGQNASLGLEEGREVATAMAMAKARAQDRVRSRGQYFHSYQKVGMHLQVSAGPIRSSWTQRGTKWVRFEWPIDHPSQVARTFGALTVL